jgi:uncharacterized iron-regulated membrane protein
MLLKLRPILFWTHLAVGVIVGVFILNMAASGILMAYQKPLVALAERSQRTVVIPAGAKALDLEALVAKVAAERPKARLSGVVLYSDPHAAAMFYVGRANNVIFANPYTAEVLGEGQKGLRGFFQFVESYHRWLALEGTARPVGQFITGTVSLGYLLLLCTGLILWLPRQWSRRRVRQSAVLDPTLQGRARDWNWHNVIGLWATPLLIVVTLSAVIMSHDWASDLLFRLTGNAAPEHRSEGGGRSGGRHGGGGWDASSQANAPVAPPDVSGFNPLWIQAAKQVPNWHSISIRFPRDDDTPAQFMIDRGDGSTPATVGQLTLDRDSGDVVSWKPYASENVGQKLRAWVRPLHTGEAGGVIGETLAVVAALSAILLVWTGFSMAWRRFFDRKKTVPISRPYSETLNSTTS